MDTQLLDIVLHLLHKRSRTFPPSGAEDRCISRYMSPEDRSKDSFRNAVLKLYTKRRPMSKRICPTQSLASSLLPVPNFAVFWSRSGQLDELREPHFRRELRQQSRLYLSVPAYGSNTVHCLRAYSQRFLLVTQRTTASCAISQSINNIKYFSFLDALLFPMIPNTTG
jgi:hypothetical protein